MKKILLLALIITLVSRSEAQNNISDSDPATIIISPQKPLAAGETELRKAIINWSNTELTSSDYKSIKAHPSSAFFPGKVKDGYVFKNATIHIQHKQIPDSSISLVSRMKYSGPWNNNLYSTGLYAVAGEYIIINVPENVNPKDLKVQIGSQSDRLNNVKTAWRRMPVITNSRLLKNGKNILTSPFGGLIYISYPPKGGSWESDFKIEHAIGSPLYVLGKTSKESWTEQLKTNKAPWGELATSNIVLTLPDSILQKVDDPQEVMKLWDLIIGGEMELAQIKQPYYRAQRIVVDEQISIGALHSGYPIMAHHSPSIHLYAADIIADPVMLMKPSKGGSNWGFFHEIGHNMQNLDWVFGGTTEVSCNFFSLYMFDRLLGGRDNAHVAIQNTNTQNTMKKYFAGSPDYEKWKADPFLGLIMFRQLQEAFGWESFKAFIREYQKFALNNDDLDDQQKRNLWVKTFSSVVQRNIAPFFEKWGIPISDATKNELDRMPAWMPYNFPPVN